MRQFTPAQETILWNALNRYRVEESKSFNASKFDTMQIITELIDELELEPQIREAKKHSCNRCGRSGERVSLENVYQHGMILDGIWLCMDGDDCENDVESRFMDYP